MSRLLAYLRSQRLLALLLAGLLLVSLNQIIGQAASGEPLGPRSLTLTSSTASAKTDFILRFTLSSPAILGSIEAQFCSNSPLPSEPCTVPQGLSLSNIQLTDQTGQVGFRIGPNSNANTIFLTRPAAPSLVGPVSYTFSNAINPSQPGSYYVRMQTFVSSDATGPANDYGGVGYAINNNLSISAEVPPYLIFCAAITIPTLNCESANGDYINFGEFSATRPSFGTSQILSSTNAKDGYNVTLAGTTLTSGNNAIAALIAADVSRPGTAQFGLNLRSNASPSGGTEAAGPGSGAAKGPYALPNFFQFQQGDIVASVPKPDLTRRYTASYLVNVPKTQAPGVYVSTVTYICLGNF